MRSITNSQKIEVFENQIDKSNKNSLKLPDLQYTNKKINYLEIRAMADSKSLRIRFSDDKVLKKYKPKGNISKKLYNVSERIRCEKIGAGYFKGIKLILKNFIKTIIRVRS